MSVSIVVESATRATVRQAWIQFMGCRRTRKQTNNG